jgi:hypothetical protein
MKLESASTKLNQKLVLPKSHYISNADEEQKEGAGEIGQMEIDDANFDAQIFDFSK